MPELIAAVGLPRSGKSTWARLTGYPIVCPDCIRLALHGRPYISQAEPYVWAVAHTMTKALFLAGHERVVLDATNTTLQRRREWLSSEWTTLFREFAATEAECLARTGDPALQAAIRRMAASREPLAAEELRWTE